MGVAFDVSASNKVLCEIVSRSGLASAWLCSLIETSDRVKWDSLISEDFIFEVSSQSLKRRTFTFSSRLQLLLSGSAFKSSISGSEYISVHLCIVVQFI